MTREWASRLQNQHVPKTLNLHASCRPPVLYCLVCLRLGFECSFELGNGCLPREHANLCIHSGWCSQLVSSVSSESKGCNRTLSCCMWKLREKSNFMTTFKFAYLLMPLQVYLANATILVAFSFKWSLFSTLSCHVLYMLRSLPSCIVDSFCCHKMMTSWL